MARKLDLVTTITIEKEPQGIIIKSDKNFCWYADRMIPEVAMTAVIGNTLAKTLDYEDYFSGEYTITLQIVHKHDE